MPRTVPPHAPRPAGTGPVGAWAAGRGSLRQGTRPRAEPRAAACNGPGHGRGEDRRSCSAAVVHRPWFAAFVRFRSSGVDRGRGPWTVAAVDPARLWFAVRPGGWGRRAAFAMAHGHGCPGGCGMPGDHDGRPGGSDRATGRDRTGPEHRSAGMTGMCGVRRAGPRAAGGPQTRQHLATAATAGGGQQDIGVVGKLPEKSEIRRNGPGGAAGVCRPAPAAQGRRPSRAPGTRPPATAFLRTARGPAKSANSSE